MEPAARVVAGARLCRAGGGDGQAARVIWEVFRQEREGQPFQHGGSLHAPNRAFAEIYAREFYTRRQESQKLWLVPRDALISMDDFGYEFEPTYRRVDGYSIKTRLREARERAGALKD